jgi:2-oxoglutarate/2-oxoacid ferredoxin oxidoreductase subunit alpha
MRFNILIGGKAGQGINKVSEIVSAVLVNQGYFTFNYRDYPSLIRGGHNFNVLSTSENRIGSIESKLDVIVALDGKTAELHKEELKQEGVVISFEEFKDLGRNLNIALSGALIKILGIDKEVLIEEVKRALKNSEDAVKAAEQGYDSQESKFDLKKLNNNIKIMTGSRAVSKGAIDSGIDLYIAYPMTPATGVMHDLASKQVENNLMVFQPENEIAVVNAGLGASFTGAKTMIGSSGGGFDLMTEGLSLQGISEIPLVVYLASRPGPGTGVPTYSTQCDLDIALRGGHGEFPRIVIAPGDPIESIEKTNEAFYLAEKFNTLSIVLSDKHLAESEFSSDRKPNKLIPVKVKRKTPGETIIKRSSYEHDSEWNTTESAELTKLNSEARIEKYNQIKEDCKNFQMIKIYGNPKAKNLIIGWGSTKTVILDAIDSIDESIKNSKGDYKFLQVLYMKPISNEIKQHIKQAEKTILIENNLTGQLGRLIREKTGISIKNRILKYDSRPFRSDELKEEILNVK